MSAGIAAILSGIGFLALLGGIGLLVRKHLRAYPVMLFGIVCNGAATNSWLSYAIYVFAASVVIALWRQRLLLERTQQLTLKLIMTARVAHQPEDAVACVFCDIVDGRGAARVVRGWDDAIAVVPRNAVVDGHLIVLPKAHVPDASDPGYAALTIHRAVALAAELYPSFDLITSVGPAATCTTAISHLHIHVVPRRPGDGLAQAGS